MNSNDNSNDGPVLFPLEGEDESIRVQSRNSPKQIINKSVVNTSKRKRFRFFLFISIFVCVSYFLFKSKYSEGIDPHHSRTDSIVGGINRYSPKVDVLNVRKKPKLNSKVVSILTKDSLYYGKPSSNEGWIEIFTIDGSRLGFSKSKYLILIE